MSSFIVDIQNIMGSRESMGCGIGSERSTNTRLYSAHQYNYKVKVLTYRFIHQSLLCQVSI